jgi:hypothetical protein
MQLGLSRARPPIFDRLGNSLIGYLHLHFCLPSLANEALQRIE